MLGITCTAVLGGLILGCAAALLARRTGRLLLFSVTGAAGGALGLLLYAISSTASNQTLNFWWQGLSWVVVCILFVITGLYIVSGDHR